MQAPKLPTVLEQPSDQARESAQAKWWRVSIAKLTVPELAQLTGYSTLAIYLMEKGIGSRGARVRAWVWMRYKQACAGVDAQLTSGKRFDWTRDEQ
jgi:hypothetical protein